MGDQRKLAMMRFTTHEPLLAKWVQGSHNGRPVDPTKKRHPCNGECGRSMEIGRMVWVDRYFFDIYCSINCAMKHWAHSLGGLRIDDDFEDRYELGAHGPST